MRHLGNIAVVKETGVPIECEACQVSWVGCAAACECPICGDPKDVWQEALVRKQLVSAMPGGSRFRDPYGDVWILGSRHASVGVWNATRERDGFKSLFAGQAILEVIT